MKRLSAIKKRAVCRHGARMPSLLACMYAGLVSAAPAVPPLHPTKDVSVTYVRSDGKRVVISTAKSGYPFRVDYPDQTADGFFDMGASYFVALSPHGPTIPMFSPPEEASLGAGNGFYVWKKTKEFYYLSSPSADWLGELKLIQYNGDDMIAGAFCSDWTIQNPHALTVHGHALTANQDRICLTADGIILRYLAGFNGEGQYSTSYQGRYPSSMTAISLVVATLPAATFAVPDGYTQKAPVPPPPTPMPPPSGPNP